MELSIIKTLSKRVEVSNANDAEKEYDIKANVTVSNGSVGNVESGTVAKDGVQKASFSQFSAKNKSVNFQCENSEETAVLAAINEFIDALPDIVTGE